MKKEQIVHYYDTCEADYRLLWDLDYSHAMHAGYWDEKTKNLRQALRRENEILAQRASIKKTDRVLDAGCGVGGSAIFLAQTYGCDVVGITLSEKQVLSARRNAEKAKVKPLPTFAVMDYTRTTFPNESFDVVWAIESVCHVEDKALFIREAFRLLKKGGRLILADGFAAQPDYEGADRARMERWLNGWGVKELDMASEFEDKLVEAGFSNIAFRDVTPHVMPSSKRLYIYSWPAIILSKLGELMGKRTVSQTENLYGARCQYQTLKKGLWRYGIFFAVKP
ncbi:SAM-dependent methyltransferase [Candidatus Protochlamydia phocaeensis]|uniref:SAM-dependent methyltransferase n=1 Tax=Candidatus Protochlamydia phocaeensis TaxID=1414722 RepID=UPI000838DFC5|nr:methyltransferase domain-containing protein [Candidatus Protochlamydia phocaeensis]